MRFIVIDIAKTRITNQLYNYESDGNYYTRRWLKHVVQQIVLHDLID